MISWVKYHKIIYHYIKNFIFKIFFLTLGYNKLSLVKSLWNLRVNNPVLMAVERFKNNLFKIPIKLPFVSYIRIFTRPITHYPWKIHFKIFNYSNSL